MTLLTVKGFRQHVRLITSLFKIKLEILIYILNKDILSLFLPQVAKFILPPILFLGFPALYLQPTQ